MPGLLTNGATVLTPAQARTTALVPVDTQYANGVSPQSAAITVGDLGAMMTMFGAALVALAGGGKVAATTQLGYGANRLSVVATAADSAQLPYAFPGAIVFVRNDGAASATIFGRGTDTIDGVASATGNAQAAGKGKFYIGISGNGDGVAGTWVTLLGA